MRYYIIEVSDKGDTHMKKRILLMILSLTLMIPFSACNTIETADDTTKAEITSEFESENESSQNNEDSESETTTCEETTQNHPCTTTQSKEERIAEIYENTENKQLPIGGWSTPASHMRDTKYEELFKLIANSGINYMITLEEWSSSYWCIDSLSAAYKAGIKLYYNCVGQSAPYSLEKINHMLASEYKDALGGIYVKDEPLLSEMEEISKLTEDIRNGLGDINIPIFSNLLPTYASEGMIGNDYRAYVRAYLDNVKSDILMFDYYPFPINGDSIAKMMANIAIAKEEADKANIPLYSFIQSSETAAMREPKYSELKMNINMNLAMGVKGISYFLICEQYENWGYSAMIDYNGESTKMFENIKKVNADINAMKGVYLDYDCKGIMLTNYISGKNELQAANCTSLIDSFDKIESITASKKTGGILTGCFENEEGEKAIFVVNLNYKGLNTANIKFTEDIEYEIWGDEGLMDIGTTKDASLNINLSIGEGVFIKIK